MSDKHKGHKKDAAPASHGHGKHDEAHKAAEKSSKTASKDKSHDMPGAAGFISAGAEEDTYD